jgi:hypothetical protein
VIWWCDRIEREARILRATRFQLVALGALMALAFNVRREAVVLVVVVASIQLVALVRPGSGRPTLRTMGDRIQASWRELISPYLAFFVSVVVMQLLLPTALFPDNGNSRAYIDDRWGEYPRTLADELALGDRPLLGIVILVLATVGVVIGVRRRPAMDVPLFVLALFSALLIGTHFRQVERYWLQVTPWVVYFATVALVGAARVIGRRHRLAGLVAIVPLVVVIVAHLVVLPGRVSDAREFDRAGRFQSGPSNPTVAPIYDAVNAYTPADSVVAFFRARTMTLLTDRRSFQTKNLDNILQSADFYAERRDSTYWQPTLDADHPGLVEVWSDARWTLWQVIDEQPSGEQLNGEQLNGEQLNGEKVSE